MLTLLYIEVVISHLMPAITRNVTYRAFRVTIIAFSIFRNTLICAHLSPAKIIGFPIYLVQTRITFSFLSVIIMVSQLISIPLIYIKTSIFLCTIARHHVIYTIIALIHIKGLVHIQNSIFIKTIIVSINLKHLILYQFSAFDISDVSIIILTPTIDKCDLISDLFFCRHCICLYV